MKFAEKRSKQLSIDCNSTVSYYSDRSDSRGSIKMLNQLMISTKIASNCAIGSLRCHSMVNIMYFTYHSKDNTWNQNNGLHQMRDGPSEI